MNMKIRPIKVEDIPFVFDLYQEPSVHRQAVLSGDELSYEQIEAWVRNWLISGEHLHFVVEDEQGMPVALSQLYSINRLQRTCEVGVLLLPHVQGKGIGQWIHEHQMQVARDVLGIQELTTQIAAYNTHSIHVVRDKWGFEQEGVRRRAVYRDDEFHDVLLLRKRLPEPVAKV